jgi:hypothetical protein
MTKLLILLLLLTSVLLCAEDNDLYGDGKYLDRWEWLIRSGVIDGAIPDKIRIGDRDLFINAFTYAIKIKYDHWKLNADIWWSPLLMDKFAVQHGYYMGMDAADNLYFRYLKTGKIGRL